MAMKLAVVVAFVLACGGAVALGQQTEQPPVTFKVEINLVEVDAFVTDAQGNPVPGLTAADFEVLEDGKPQKISGFSLVNIPIERGDRPLFASAPIEPDVQTNRLIDGRIYLIVLDDLHTDFTRTPRVKAALRQFIERNFGTNDVAAIVYTSGRMEASQDFTSSPRLLLASVDKFIGRKNRSGTLERIDEYNRRASSGQDIGTSITDPLDMERGFQAKSTMTSIRKLAEFIGDVHGRRKAMIFVSEGIDYNVLDVFNNSSASAILDETREAIAAATRANMSIYAVDPRGLTGFDDADATFTGYPNGADATLNLGPGAMQDELRLSQDSLRVISDETGGFATLNRNDFAQAFGRITRENSTYYVLAYSPANERRDGRYRKLEVRVKRPGLRVASRKGYVAPRGRAPAVKPATGDPIRAAAAEMMASPLPVSGMRMSVTAAPYKGSAPNATVALAIELAGSDFTFVEKDGIFIDRLEVSFIATDASGKTFPGDRHAVDLTMKPDTHARLKDKGFRVVSEMNLPPGRYQLRVAAADTAKSGSVLYDVDVPDFYKAPLTMSGITMTSGSAAQAPTVAPKDSFPQMLPAPRSTLREFTRGEEIALFAEFYENAAGAPPHNFDITTTIRADDGRVVFENREQRSSTDLQGGRGGYGYAARLSTLEFAPGAYVVHVEGRSRLSGGDTGIGRDVLIRIK
jgi:VWFA-related protein